MARRGIDDSRRAAYGILLLGILILRQVLHLIILLVRFHRADLVEVLVSRHQDARLAAGTKCGQRSVAPFAPTQLVLTRPAYTNVTPGDYGFLVADAATAEPA